DQFPQGTQFVYLAAEKLDDFAGILDRPVVNDHDGPECTKIMRNVGCMKLRLDYGTTGLFADFPDDRTTVIEPAYVPSAADPRATLAAALRSPLGRRPLRELVRPGQKIAISVCDITRAQPRQ